VRRLVLLGVSLLALTVISACKPEQTVGQGQPQPVVEALPATKAVADVDARATLALKQDLVTKYPQNTAGTVVEAGLTKDGYVCEANPSAPAERACLKAVREGACEINVIVRSQPYMPEKAQVIKICEVDASPAAN
jgi:hypothetical protein